DRAAPAAVDTRRALEPCARESDLAHTDGVGGQTDERVLALLGSDGQGQGDLVEDRGDAVPAELTVGAGRSRRAQRGPRHVGVELRPGLVVAATRAEPDGTQPAATRARVVESGEDQVAGEEISLGLSEAAHYR